MDLHIVDRYFARLTFGIAVAIMAFAVCEAFVNLFGLSLISRVYTAGRLLELGAILLVFVIVQLLRQIREELRRQRTDRPS